MFLVGVAGPHLTVSGAIFEERFVSQRLTDYIYLGPLPTFGGRPALDHSIRRVAQVLCALDKATKELVDYYSKLDFKPMFVSTSTPKSHGSRPLLVPLFPIGSHVVPPSFQEFTTVGGEAYKVNYRCRLNPNTSSGVVFTGTITRGSDQAKHGVIIKFTATYCGDAHRKLAEMGRAPHLWFCDSVESVGMFVVVMAYEDGARTREQLVEREHLEQLRTAIKTLHGEGYVHGDIRWPNALITTSGLKLIDFDWCGKEGVARYPADIFMDSEYKWHEGVYRGGLIAKDHNKHMFEVLTGVAYTL